MVYLIHNNYQVFMNNKFLSDDDFQRFKKYVNKKDDGCWFWNGYKDKDGYGIFTLLRKRRKAHRVSWYAVNGMIKDGYVIHHKCKNRSCVNPSHLSQVSKRENSLSQSKGVGAINAAKTHCKNGHKFDKVYGIKKKQRCCSICENEKSKRLQKKWNNNQILKGI